MALSAHALTTVATVKDELAITVSTYDSYLERLVNVYSEAIENFCGRHFEQGTGIVEKVAGHFGMYLIVDRTPLTSISSITFNGSTIDSTSYEIDGAGSSGKIRLLGGAFSTAPILPNIMNDIRPGDERKLYTVTYTGGYVLPGTGQTLPYDLEQACVLACATAYRARGRDRSITSESLLSASVAYADISGSDNPSALPADVQGMLLPYRKMVFV